MRFKGKNVLITGAGSPITCEIAKRFALEGARVVLNDKESARGTVSRVADMVSQINSDDSVKKTRGSAVAIIQDISTESGVNILMKRINDEGYNSIPILVNAASSYQFEDVREGTLEQWNADVINVLTTTFLCSRAVLPSMIENKSGAIINLSSVNGLMAFGGEAYSAAKAGVINLTKNMAVEYGIFGVRVNAVSLGSIVDLEKPLTWSESWHKRFKEDSNFLEKTVGRYPLGRTGTPLDAANAIMFLASDDASWITGTNLVVDGGLTAGNVQFLLDLAPHLWKDSRKMWAENFKRIRNKVSE